MEGSSGKGNVRFIGNDTWELCDLPKDQKALPTKWVFDTRNPGALKERFKARLVARGDIATKGIDFEETYAPVVNMVSIRLLIVISALLDLEIEHWDVVAAFLNGIIDHEIYIKQPQGFEDGSARVCRLKKAIYGLPQSARTFYFRLNEKLSQMGFHHLETDWAIWIKDNAYITCHVDDMMVSRNRDFVDRTFSELVSRRMVTRGGTEGYSVIGHLCCVVVA